MFQQRVLAMAAFCLLFAAAGVLGQGTTGQITGTVTDPNGAVVAGASVKATNTATNLVRETTTSSDGIYSIQLLPPGRYTVEIAASGFAPAKAEADVNITQTTPVNVQLAVGEVATNTVTVDAPVLQSETSQQGRVVTGETIRQLPAADAKLSAAPDALARCTNWRLEHDRTGPRRRDDQRQRTTYYEQQCTDQRH